MSENNSDVQSIKSFSHEFMTLGGSLEGFNYCAGCNEKKTGLLMLSSCEHCLCTGCSSKYKKSPVSCPECKKIGTVCKPPSEWLNISTALNATFSKLPPNFGQEEKSQNDTRTTTRRPGRKTTPIVNKRNAKGETMLQIACIARDTKKVVALIADGADVNTQDNSGWTSLHEAAIHGSEEIAQALLRAGALVDIPGDMNMTPLHDAVFNNQPKIAKLLINHGANINARNSKGQRAIDLASTEEMKSLLEGRLTSPPAAPTRRKTVTESPVREGRSCLLLATSRDQALAARIKAFGQRFKLKITSQFTDKVTHVVTAAEDGVCRVSVEMLHGLLGGKVIVSSQWIDDCTEAEKLLDPLLFEVKGTQNFPTSLAPQRARENEESKGPGLFNGCNVYLRHATCDFSLDDSTLNKTAFVALIRLGGGKVLTREPKPDAADEAVPRVPYHARPDGPLAVCSDLIVCWPGDERIQYNMPHIRTLSVAWLVQSMETFALVDGPPFFNSSG